MEKPPSTSPPDMPFVNEMRLNVRQWCCAIAILIATIWGTPRLWKRIETFDTGRDYRIPYALSKDYWLYQRRIETRIPQTNILILGDSVVWGEYVLPDGTLSHFLNEQLGQPDRFINAGVNGLYPLAIEGLVDSYAPLHNRKVILHCNVLWMTSPKADLSETKPQRINHSRLLPQFKKIPSYKADANERLSVLIERNVQFQSWVTHLQTAYFDNKSIPVWTLADDGNDPPKFPNAHRNPLTQIAMRVPSGPTVDPERGPASPRHKAWNQTGGTPAHFDWVQPDQSLQWGAFSRTLEKLKSRGNDVFVVIGPFNEHIIAPESKDAFLKIRQSMTEELKRRQIPFAQPEVLPSELYADGSHPLTSGYSLLAERLRSNPAFQSWLGERP